MAVSRTTRRAVTVIEVLVVLVVAVLAIGLAAVFIVRLRETGQRVQCENNLKLIGEAFRMYHDKSSADRAFKQLPPSRIADGYATWAVLLAPFITSESVLKQWDVEQSYFAQKEEIRQASLIQYFCPARARTETLSVAGDLDRTGTHFAGALGDYAAVAGDGSADHDWTSDKANGPLIMAELLERKDGRIVKWQSQTNLANLKRGASIVLLVGEKHVPAGQFGDAAVGDGSVYNGGRPANFSRVAGPGFPIAPGVDAPFNKNFGSYHGNGACPFVHADTSVLWMTPDVSEDVLGQLATRGD